MSLLFLGQLCVCTEIKHEIVCKYFCKMPPKAKAFVGGYVGTRPHHRISSLSYWVEDYMQD